MPRIEQKNFHYSASAGDGWGETAWKAAMSLREKQLSGEKKQTLGQRRQPYSTHRAKSLTLQRPENKKWV